LQPDLIERDTGNLYHGKNPLGAKEDQGEKEK